VSTPAVGIHAEASQQTGTVNTPNKLLAIANSIGNFAIAGGVAALLLAVVELADLNIQLTQVFESSGERWALIGYASVNLLVEASIAAFIGLLVHLSGALQKSLERVLAGRGKPASRHRNASYLLLVAAGAVIANQHGNANGYTTLLLRETEKLPHLARLLLPVEKPLSYLVMAGLLIVCWALWTLTSHSAGWSALRRRMFQAAFILIAAFAYYVDSRLEVQQYEYSFHRTMFLAATAASLATVGSVCLSSDRLQSAWRRFRIPVLIAAGVLIVVGVAFTFAKFDGNQNLKTQIFYRSTQAKQNFKLLQWVLDFDRDGYSSLLGGGDCSDGRAAINPGARETVGDGIDNNCIGDDLTRESLLEWQRQFGLLHAAANPAPKRYNLIYIFIDTLRADHLGVYGYPRGTSPNIDRLGAKSCVFENAYSPSPYTYEAAPKFMQSAYWDGHYETWTEVLARNGYHTILFPRRLPMLLRYVKGMQQVVDAARKGLRQTIDAAIDELGRVPSDKPFCAYIYSSDPHRPYRKHQGINFGPALIDQYDGEVAYTDFHLGRLFDWLETSGHMNDTMVVVMADHGESFGERMVYKHNSQVYDEQMKVPAIFYVPGAVPSRVRDYVSTVDLGPTILNIFGIDCPAQYAGVSLLPAMRGEPFRHPPIYGEHDLVENSVASPEEWVQPEIRKFMVITQDGYKLIYNRNYYCFELYDLKKDPKELQNIYDRLPDKSAELKRLLGRFVDVVGFMRPPDADEQKHAGSLDDEESVK
jgi:arylsulfatase A-like enzyme